MKEYRTISHICSNYDGAGNLFYYGYDKDCLYNAYRNAFESIDLPIDVKNCLLQTCFDNELHTMPKVR